MVSQYPYAQCIKAAPFWAHSMVSSEPLPPSHLSWRLPLCAHTVTCRSAVSPVVATGSPPRARPGGALLFLPARGLPSTSGRWGLALSSVTTSVARLQVPVCLPTNHSLPRVWLRFICLRVSAVWSSAVYRAGP